MSDALVKRPGVSAREKRALAERLLREKKERFLKTSMPVHRQFASQVARTPDAIAVSFEGQSLSYRELDERSNQVAQHLRSLGVGPEVLVGLCVERSAEMVVGLLGVLKAGGAYVPLDPAYPAERIGLMIEDSRTPVLLSQRPLLDRLHEHDATVVCLDADDLASQPRTDPEVGAGTDQLAYVIYTSGSTGRPKGVMVSHDALANFLRAMRQTLGIQARDTLLAVTTLSFDIAALELLLPLTVGARVAIATRETAADGVELARLLEESGSTLMQATPATWRLLLESGWSGCVGLTMLCGGEPLPRELAGRLLEKGERLWNLYGPTETTVWATAAEVTLSDGPVTIGRPIPGWKAFVLDARRRPVPVGVVGELYLGGTGLARGYLDRPSLTAERFVPDPFGVPGGRLYRTGDLARWRSDGTLECLGRVDHQVKIRGHRVELGEVEAALAEHPAVRRSAASAVPDASGEFRLVAYVLPEPGEDVVAERLRAFLQKRLPDYLVPSIFVPLTALPLTPNGKVDRKALPAPEDVGVETGRPHVAPRTPTEEVVANFWGNVLGRERVGAHDDFFELGGHSLLATRVVSRLRDTFGVEIPLSVLFETPTVAGLARRVEEARRVGRDRAVPPILLVPRGGELPLSSAQQALWFLEQLAPGRPTFNVTASVRIDGPLDLDALTRSFAEILRRHEILRTKFATVDGRPVQVIMPAEAMPLPLEIHDLRDLPDERRMAEARRLGIEASRRPFDLARGPLIQARLLRLGESENAVVLGMHHIITDGWSFGVATRELSALYVAFRDGQPSPLPELPVQYADYAVWQRERTEGRGSQRAGQLLATPAHRRPRPGAADRSPAPSRPDRQRRGPRICVAGRPRPGNPGSQPSRGHHAVHDAPGGPSGPPATLQRPGRYRRRLADRQPGPVRDRGTDRLLREHAGAPDGPLGRPELP